MEKERYLESEEDKRSRYPPAQGEWVNCAVPVKELLKRYSIEAQRRLLFRELPWHLIYFIFIFILTFSLNGAMQAHQMNSDVAILALFNPVRVSSYQYYVNQSSSSINGQQNTFSAIPLFGPLTGMTGIKDLRNWKAYFDTMLTEVFCTPDSSYICLYDVNNFQKQSTMKQNCTNPSSSLNFLPCQQNPFSNCFLQSAASRSSGNELPVCTSFVDLYGEPSSNDVCDEYDGLDGMQGCDYSTDANWFSNNISFNANEGITIDLLSNFTFRKEMINVGTKSPKYVCKAEYTSVNTDNKTIFMPFLNERSRLFQTTLVLMNPGTSSSISVDMNLEISLSGRVTLSTIGAGHTLAYENGNLTPGYSLLIALIAIMMLINMMYFIITLFFHFTRLLTVWTVLDIFQFYFYCYFLSYALPVVNGALFSNYFTILNSSQQPPCETFKSIHDLYGFANILGLLIIEALLRMLKFARLVPRTAIAWRATIFSLVKFLQVGLFILLVAGTFVAMGILLFGDRTMDFIDAQSSFLTLVLISIGIDSVSQFNYLNQSYPRDQAITWLFITITMVLFGWILSSFFLAVVVGAYENIKRREDMESILNARADQDDILVVEAPKSHDDDRNSNSSNGSQRMRGGRMSAQSKESENIRIALDNIIAETTIQEKAARRYAARMGGENKVVVDSIGGKSLNLIDSASITKASNSKISNSLVYSIDEEEESKSRWRCCNCCSTKRPTGVSKSWRDFLDRTYMSLRLLLTGKQSFDVVGPYIVVDRLTHWKKRPANSKKIFITYDEIAEAICRIDASHRLKDVPKLQVLSIMAVVGRVNIYRIEEAREFEKSEYRARLGLNVIPSASKIAEYFDDESDGQGSSSLKKAEKKDDLFGQESSKAALQNIDRKLTMISGKRVEDATRITSQIKTLVEIQKVILRKLTQATESLKQEG